MPPASGAFRNGVRADANIGNNSSTATTTISSSSDLAVAKTATATATAGTNLTYNITVTNNGPSDSAAVTMSDTLPPNTTFVSESQGTGPTFICANPPAGGTGTGKTLTYTIVVTNGGPKVANSVVVTDLLPAGTTYQSSTPAGACSGTTTITCNAGTLANGSSATITLTITLPATPGAITNSATASAAPSSPDTNLGNNTATSTITVIPAANIPMVSPLSLLFLCVALAVAGVFVQKQ